MARSESLATFAERWGPYIGGAVAVVAGAVAYSRFVDWFAMTGMNGKDAIGASFNVLVTLTAFLFSVFVLAIAPGGGFLQTIFGTQTFRIFKRYVVESLLLGVIASVWSLPFMFTQNGAGIWNQPWAQVAWAAVTIAAVLAFFRVAHIFLVWVSLGSKKQGRGRNA